MLLYWLISLSFLLTVEGLRVCQSCNSRARAIHRGEWTYHSDVQGEVSPQLKKHYTEPQPTQLYVFLTDIFHETVSFSHIIFTSNVNNLHRSKGLKQKRTLLRQYQICMPSFHHPKHHSQRSHYVFALPMVQKRQQVGSLDVSDLPPIQSFNFLYE